MSEPRARPPVTDWAVDFDHMDPKWTEDPYAIWSDLRQRCPVAHTERYGGVYLPTRMADIREAAYDPETYSNRRPVVREAMRETDPVVCDPATRRCAVVMPELGPEEGHRAVARMRDLCASRLECPVRGDLAVFPRDGWVFPDLVEVAEKQAQQAAGMTLVTHEPLRS